MLIDMNCKTITERLKRVAAIVDSWSEASGVPQIERDIALEELRAIYNELLIIDITGIDNATSAENVAETVEVVAEKIEEVVAETPAEEQTSPSSDVASMESFYDALDIDALLGISDEPVEEPVAEPEPEVAEIAPETLEESDDKEEEKVDEQTPIAVVETTSETTLEQVVEPSPAPEVQKPVGAGLFDLEDIPVRTKSRRKMISLYSDNPIPAQSPAEPVKVEPKAAEKETKQESVPVESLASTAETPSVAEPVAPASPVRLGDTFSGVKTLADQMAKDETPTTPFNRITELRQAIGLNDKFLMIRDLFGGDAARYEATIDTLDEFDDLDECIIYIVENFRWNPDLEAAKLLVSLIERKLA